MSGLDLQPRVEVQQREYQRLLGLPFDLALTGRMRELSGWARAWFAEHGRPWVHTVAPAGVTVEDDAILVEGGAVLHSGELAKRFRNAQAEGVVVAAVSAGPEAEEEAGRLWEAGRPDEYFFLTVYASAVVEHLATMTGARLCDWAEGRGMAVLPQYSPGYPGWDMADQAELFRLAEASGDVGSRVQLEILDSGMLRPKKSQLCAFGLTRRRDLVRRLTDLVPCEGCSFARCRYRRAPYRMPVAMAETAQALHQAMNVVDGGRTAREGALRVDARYDLSPRVLEKWRRDRLRLDRRDDGRIVARFRHEGSTCSNMGRPLAFDHTVTLSPGREGYRILATSCVPSALQGGHKEMCSYLQKEERQLTIIDEEKPLMGQPLDRVLDWKPILLPAGCYCARAGRNHKWRNVLQTLHYALVQDEKDTAADTD